MNLMVSSLHTLHVSTVMMMMMAELLSFVGSWRQSREARDGAGAGASGEDGLTLTLWEKAAAGCFSGMANAPFRAVFERVKSVMQVREEAAGGGAKGITKSDPNSDHGLRLNLGLRVT